MATTAAGAVSLKFIADLMDLQAKMRQVPGLVGGAMDHASRSIERTNGLLAKFGIALSVGAVALWARSIVNGMDALDEMSQRLGIGAGELSRLQLAFKQAGMGPEQMGTNLARLSKEMATGSKELKALGVDLNGSVTDALLTAADAIAGMEDGAKKTALAMAIFGKSAGPEMVGLLNSGSAGIREMMEMAQKLGLVVSDDVAAQAGQFNDTIELIGLGVTGVGQGIAAQLLPTLQGLAGQFLSSMTEGDRLANTAQFLGNMLKGLYVVALGVVEVFQSVGKWVGAIAAAAVAAATGEFGQVASIVKSVSVDVGSDWQKTLGDMQKAWNANGDATVVAGAKMVKSSRNVLDEVKRLDEAEKARGVAIAKEQEAFDSLITSIRTKIAEQKQELTGSEKLTESQKISIKLTEDLAGGKLKLSGTHLTVVQAAIQELAVQEKLAAQAKAAMVIALERQKLRTAEADGIAAFMQAEQQAAQQSLNSVKDRIISLQDEEAAAQIARHGNVSLAQAVEMVTIARLAERQEQFNAGSEGWENIQKEIDKRKELLGLIAAKDVREEWGGIWESVDKTAHDVFVNIFDGGQDVFSKLGNTIKATVLDLLYQMTIKKWIINISANTSGVSGLLGSLTGGGEGGGFGLGDIFSAGKDIYGAFTGAGLGSTAAGLLGSGVSALFGGVAGNAAIASALGLGASSAAAAATAAAAAGGAAAATATAAAGIGASIGSFAAAFGPWAIAAMAVFSLVKKFDTSGTPHVGGMAQYSEADGLATSQKHGAFGMGFGGVDYNEGGAKLVESVSKTVVGLLDSMSKGFGGEGGFKVSTGFADDSSKDGAWGGLLIEQFGKALVNWDDSRSSKWAPKVFADGEAGQKEYLAAVSKDVLGVLKDMDLPGWAQDTLTALGDTPALEELAKAIDYINSVKAALDVMAKNLVGFAGYSDEAASALIKASGGIQALAANASTYYDLFYSEEEKRARATRDVTDALAKVNIALPTSAAQYRALVEQYTAMGAEGADVLAVLFAMAGAFKAIVPPGADVVAEIETLADVLARLRSPVRGLEDIARNIIDLEEQLWQAQNEGNTDAIRARQLAGLTEEEAAIQRLIWALADQKRATDAAADAAAAAAAKAAQVRSEYEGLQNQYWQATGNNEAIRAAQLAALANDENRAMQVAIWAALDKQAAEAAAQQAAQASASAYEQAAQAAMQAAQQIRDAWKGVSDSLVNEIKRIRGEVLGDNDMGYSAAQAAFAIATAQARAGDQDAAKNLPALSQSMLALAEKNEATDADVRRMMAITAASLAATNAGVARRAGITVPSYDVGTAYVPYDQLAMLHQGERVLTRSENQSYGSGSAGSDAAELRQEVASLRADLRVALGQIALNTGKTAKKGERDDIEGMKIRNPTGKKLEVTIA